jgi:hypothetical protein
MEGIALTLIGAAVFSHSWHLLGLYDDSRTVGVIMGALALALLASLFFEPQLVGTQGLNDVRNLGEISIMKVLIGLWAVYTAAVAAQAAWDMEERAIGFYSVVLAAGSSIALFYYLQTMIDGAAPIVMIPLVVVSGLLALTGTLLFFLFALPLPVLKTGVAWIVLIASILVTVVGLSMVSTIIAF